MRNVSNKNKHMKCKFCGAENDSSAESVENMLAVAKNSTDGKVFTVFILIIIGIVVGTYFFYTHSDHKVLAIILSVIVAGGAILGWGAFIGTQEDIAVKKKYDKSIKAEIFEYLKEMHFKPIDFKIVAADALSSDAHLIKFIDDF